MLIIYRRCAYRLSWFATFTFITWWTCNNHIIIIIIIYFTRQSRLVMLRSVVYIN